MTMTRLIIKSVFASALLFWAVWDLTGSAAGALLLATLPLALGVSNLMPFAAFSLPVAVAIAAAAVRIWPELGLDVAAASFRDHADQVRQLIVAPRA